MEPNNFEKDFREKLNQREIEPSNKAWDRLDAMLTVAEEKEPVKLNSKKSKRKWLYIAASFIGFLLVGTLYFNQNKNAVKTPETVVVEKETEAEKESVTKPVLNTADSVKTEIAIAEKTSEKTINKNKKSNSEASEQISNKIIKNESNQIAESSIIKNNQEKQSTNNPTLIAETSKQDDVDQLLEKAETKILAENAVKSKSKIKINSNDLLDQVDGELELSFREKMIAKINKSYQTVKVAVENRNVKN
ncbi:hypothetical protein BSF41_11600 [Flavobacterium sp. ACN2]|jgi:hypothetical protein|uniref:hypothetical protein n=1 Tax=Flavobacterium sp. ACN2 TaxID=1975676 RepID=UPI000BB38586|nr:hypothetical protein [Flavobacterium sp. ACN2]PBI91559.1 hypothetical protein BSF41_11600 [Flavobacterium sp. ACN2]